ncbi:MAG: sigma 54-interacting transcriptional regulator [Planctomycetota bacterium]|jgi:transcriptional regulator with GAF, ATPase, and Fis domain
MPTLTSQAGDERIIHRVAEGGATLGRGSECEVPVRDGAASRRHCRVEQEDGRWFCRDLDSHNGTRVNGLRIARKRLVAGDEIAIGRTRFVFDPDGAAEPDEIAIESSQPVNPPPNQSPAAESGTTAGHGSGQGPDAGSGEAPELDATRTETPPPPGDWRREREQLLQLQRIAAAFNATLDSAKLLPLVLDSAIELTGAERGFIMLRDPGHAAGGGWRFPAARSFDTAEDVASPATAVSRSIAERVFHAGEPLLTDDAQSDPGLQGARSVQEQRIRSVACVPLRVGGAVAGVCYLDNPFQRGIFTEADLRVLEAFADHAGVALQTARLIETAGTAEDLGGARGGLALLGVVSRLAQSGLQFEKLAGTLAGLLLEALDSDRAAVIVRDPSGGLHTFAQGREGTAAAGDQLLSTGIVSSVLDTGEALRCDDVSDDPRFRDRASVKDLGIVAACCTPLPGRIGALYVDRSGPARLYDPADLEWLRECAARVTRPLENARSYQARVDEVRAVRRDYTRTLDELTARVGYGRLIGDHPSMREVYATLDRLRGKVVPVLIQGESGTGKELVARILHQQSPRRDGPFGSENCAALAEGVLERELFGHVQGAFTSADRDQEGLFQRADGGTLFLDECGEMSPKLQGALLRALDEGAVRPVGGGEPVACDVRLLAATNRDLRAEVDGGAFREDLYFRLAVVTVTLPPLRERRSDIPQLLSHFLAEVAAEHGGAPRTVSAEALELLTAWDWPGNVRELRNEAVRLGLFAEPEQGVITPAQLDARFRGETAAGTEPSPLEQLQGRTLKETLEAQEREILAAAFDACERNKARAARMLGLSWLGLSKKLQRHGLTPPSKE